MRITEWFVHLLMREDYSVYIHFNKGAKLGFVPVLGYNCKKDINKKRFFLSFDHHYLLFIFNCSQTKFVAIILVLLVFFYAIFRLTDFSSDVFDFSSSKTG